MAVEFEYWEEEMMKKKIREKAMKILTESKACVDLPDDLKEYAIEACRRCVSQISITEADPNEVQKCLFEELANMYFGGIPKKMLEQLKQCLDVVLKDLLKACSGHEDEAR